MFYEPDKNNHGLKFSPFKSIIVPRPIGWISTVSTEGVLNLAPFSQTTNVSFAPPYIMISCAEKPDGGPKDTVKNCMDTGEFDALSPLAHTERMMRVLRCPKQLIVYQGAGHSASGTPSTALGPFYPTTMADWMNARFAGEKFASERWFVDHAGRVERAPYR